jgi:uncharacterized repeat protein (TIGR03803 family)
MSWTMTNNRSGSGSWQWQVVRAERRRCGTARVIATAVWLLSMLATSGAQAQVFSTLRAFSGRDGSTPSAALVQGRDGIFYGTTQLGGEWGLGTLFAMRADGSLTVLYELSGPEGADIFAPLVIGRDGQLYGTTALGGPGGLDGKGTVFRFSTDGGYVPLHFFSGTDGAHPQTGLTVGADGVLYGTTTRGGEYDLGTVFAITPDGEFRTVHSFFRKEGDMSLGELLLGRDGWLYGTAVAGGPANTGTVFRVSPSQGFSVLHVFAYYQPSEGVSPRGSLVQGADGCIYGTTEFGGAYGNGTVFRMAPDGTYVDLHSFTQSEGTNPLAGLILAGDGRFYGTTSSGGQFNSGTLFAMTPRGSVSVVHAFTGDADGGLPVSALMQARDGHLYGTTPLGGASSTGTVFRVTLPRHMPRIPFRR